MRWLSLMWLLKLIATVLTITGTQFVSQQVFISRSPNTSALVRLLYTFFLLYAFLLLYTIIRSPLLQKLNPITFNKFLVTDTTPRVNNIVIDKKRLL